MPGIAEIYFLKNSFNASVQGFTRPTAHNAIEPKRAVTTPMSVATRGGADEVNAELVNFLWKAAAKRAV
jgi:hypothetical protein